MFLYLKKDPIKTHKIKIKKADTTRKKRRGAGEGGCWVEWSRESYGTERGAVGESMGK